MTTELARLQNFGPNWFASVTGHRRDRGRHPAGARAGSAGVLRDGGRRRGSAGRTRHRGDRAVGRHPTVARSHVRNPQMTHFYGAAPMALMTVGAGALLVGADLIGERVAVDLAWVLWTAGTVGGLFTAATIPFLMFTQLNVEPKRRSADG